MATADHVHYDVDQDLDVHLEFEDECAAGMAPIDQEMLLWPD